MPSVSQKQHDLMVSVSTDSTLAEKLNIDQKVAKEFLKKDAEEGLWQEAPEMDFDVESITLEDQALIPDEVRRPDPPAFRLEDRFG